MADQVRTANYCYVKVPHRAGQGVPVLTALAEAGVNLIAYSGFPAGGGKAQLDFVAEDLGALRRVARQPGWRVSPTKKCFVIRGEDRLGAVQRHLDKLAQAGVSVTAADAVTAGDRRYGMLLWVKPRDHARAARALGAR